MIYDTKLSIIAKDIRIYRQSIAKVLRAEVQYVIIFEL